MSETDEGRDSTTSSDAGMQSFSYLFSGIVLYGGLGWLLDRFLHIGWLLPAGLLVGMAAGIYLVIKRFGSGA
ncbi:Putative F0F1-ATPase subunit Ca2+/Mg2+ transporter [Propionibacterium cyclohexanicum]|uniref:Putative F0F1-ATPase subunit Ca2+/Mg2+ transporter n=1 Tax=Propionibacterium cyclohexanicum TaxID=64702 RepID=A0A1H9R211_9ACTN|nr:AtpZ/AtpI family protein [Propionibacterium cyclohexanicum]SER66023.1 Putative F0F1-ATPase subunit Ca2+/Mg2+ transporter [Propionibacterium cyclohexanicum]